MIISRSQEAGSASRPSDEPAKPSGRPASKPLSWVTDPRAQAQRGVLATPAVAIDATVKLSGKLPSVQELVTLFINHVAAAEASRAQG